MRGGRSSGKNWRPFTIREEKIKASGTLKRNVMSSVNIKTSVSILINKLEGESTSVPGTDNRRGDVKIEDCGTDRVSCII